MNTNDKNFIAAKIRSQYVEKESTELDELRALDSAVKRPVNIFAYVFGSIGAVIMGAGMSLVMTDIGSTIGITDAMLPGIVTGVAGMLITLINYPIYKGLLASRKQKYAPKILSLSEKIINE